MAAMPKATDAPDVVTVEARHRSWNGVAAAEGRRCVAQRWLTCPVSHTTLSSVAEQICLDPYCAFDRYLRDNEDNGKGKGGRG